MRSKNRNHERQWCDRNVVESSSSIDVRNVHDLMLDQVEQNTLKLVLAITMDTLSMVIAIVITSVLG